MAEVWRKANAANCSQRKLVRVLRHAHANARANQSHAHPSRQHTQAPHTSRRLRDIQPALFLPKRRAATQSSSSVGRQFRRRWAQRYQMQFPHLRVCMSFEEHAESKSVLYRVLLIGTWELIKRSKRHRYSNQNQTALSASTTKQDWDSQEGE